MYEAGTKPTPDSRSGTNLDNEDSLVERLQERGRTGLQFN